MEYPSSVEEIRQIADLAMRPVIGGFESVALVGFPDHSNVGDSAIWLGELAYLRAQSVDIAYSCSSASYRKENLERHTELDTPILIHGGGYFGDIWKEPLDFMLQVVMDFPDRPIIVMPQTIHFASSGQLERVRDLVNRHSEIVICTRDHRSEDFARQHFEHPVVLSPDSAVFLDLHSSGGGTGILYIAREDREAAADQLTVLGPEIVKMDWLGLPAPTSRARASSVVLHRTKKRIHSRISGRESAGWHEHLAASTRNALAKRRLERGVRLLTSGGLVVTDRLHAHILSALLDLPNVVLDNSYGKVRAYFESWSANLPSTHWASHPDDVPVIVTEMLRAGS